MTNLFDRISEDIKTAMLARERVKLEALRSIKKEFIEAKTAKGADGELSDDTAFKILQKMAKQRQESAQIYQANGREEMAAAELAEAEVIAQYLPQQLTLEEIQPIVKTIITELAITDPKQMGRVIGVVQKQLQGKADGKMIANVVKDELSKLG